MNQRQFVKFCKNQPDLVINLPAVIVYLVIRLLDLLLQLIVVLQPLLLRLDRDARAIVEILVLVEYLLVQFLDLFEKLVEVLLDFLHLRYLFPGYRFLTALRSWGDQTLLLVIVL